MMTQPQGSICRGMVSRKAVFPSTLPGRTWQSQIQPQPQAQMGSKGRSPFKNLPLSRRSRERLRNKLALLAIAICTLLSPISAEDSFTIQLHPTPVAVGEICRLGMSAPVAIEVPKAMFQDKTYSMRRLSDLAYSVTLPTKGLSPGEYHGQIVVRLHGQSLQLPFVVPVSAPIMSRHADVERGSTSLILDAKTETALKMNRLEMDLDRVSLEKEVLQQRIDALSSNGQETAASREARDRLAKDLVEKEKELTEKSAALAQAWDRLSAQETELRVTAQKLEEKEVGLRDKEHELIQTEWVLASQNRELSSKTAVLKQWEGVLQQQSSDIETEKTVLRESQLELQQRQQDLQEKRRVLDQMASALHVKTESLLIAQEMLKSDKTKWGAHQSEQSAALAEKSQKQEQKDRELQQSMAALSIEKQHQEAAQAALRKEAEILEKDKASLHQQQSKMAEKDSRLMSLYQEFQQHQERFFGLAEQLQTRMAAMEETQKKDRVRSDAMSLRLSQLEQINASLIAPTTEAYDESATENSKKKTK